MRPRGVPRLLAGTLLAAGALVGVLAVGASAQDGGPVVEVAEADGVLDGTVARYLTGVLDDAAASGADVVVLQLDVRAAVGDAAVRVAEAVRSSAVPVVTWVGPPGARATGGGLLVAQAGHLAAAAPGTLLGPGAPVDLTPSGGGDDAGHYARLTPRAEASADVLEGAAVAVAPAGGEQSLPDDVPLPAGVARADVTVLDPDALAERGIVDLVAVSLPDLVVALDGREVSSDGAARPLAVDSETAEVRFNNLGIVGQVLHALTDPRLAYLLLVGGALALAFEVFQPGFGMAGFSGLALAALGAYGFVVLPTRWPALVLVLLGVLLQAVDLAIGRLGALTVGGVVAFAAGSVWLLPGPAPLDLPLWTVALVTLGVVVFFVALTAVLRAQGGQAAAGAERVVGETGVVRSMLNPEGHVFVGGALWRARAPAEAGRVSTGTPVRVLGLTDELTLEVVPLEGGGDAEAPPGERPSVVG